jgi:predicted DCC family thiol-disulfide oxidoreductase YuxK|tara:strand:+ start:1881 stop:2198 length:318 start_codon:yes stop_codon:yes gene_type:complete
MEPKLEPGVDIAYRSIESDDAQNLIIKFPEWQQKANSVYLLRNGRSYVRSAAVIRCLLYLRWYWKMWFLIPWNIPLPIRDMVYRFVAKYRHLIFKKPEYCTFRVD